MADNFRESIRNSLRRVFDPYAHAVTVISEPHRLIHDGFFFDASGIVASIANGANLDILLTFPALTFGHMTLVEFTLEDGPVDVFFYEDTVTSADGTVANVRNHNRVNANDTSGAVVTTGPTVTAVGTLLHERFIPSAGGAGATTQGLLVGGEDAEWVMGDPAVQKKYMWRVTNNSGAAIKASWHFNGYELGYES